MKKHIITGIFFILVIGFAFIFFSEDPKNTNSHTQTDKASTQVDSKLAENSQNIENSQNTQKALPPAATNAKQEEQKQQEEQAPDWSGQYQGILPCESCQGIETSIILTTQDSYKLTQKYLGTDKIITDEGKLVWLEAGDIILVSNKDGSEKAFKIIEDSLAMLDGEGKLIETNGNLDANYVLNKTSNE